MKRRRSDDTQPPPLSDDELSSLVVSEPQREGWLATQSCHRPRDEALRVAIREAFISLGQEENPHSQLEAGLADHVADYLYASLHFTFVAQLQPQSHVSVLSSKWGGLPFLFADEQWPSCEEEGCNRAPLRFFFQIRQADYPLLLQHATWVRPSSSNSIEPQDDGRLLFQFFYCQQCQECFSNSLLGDRHGLQHSIARSPQHDELSEESTEDWLSDSRWKQLPLELTHPSRAAYTSLMRVIDPDSALGPGLDPSRLPTRVRRELNEPRYAECSLTGWRSYPDYPSRRQDVDSLLSRCPSDIRPALTTRLQQYSNHHFQHVFDNEALCVDRMGGWAVWTDETRYSYCPIDGCHRRLQFFCQVWLREPDARPNDVQTCVGVITQCRVHRHFFHFSWNCDVMGAISDLGRL